MDFIDKVIEFLAFLLCVMALFGINKKGIVIFLLAFLMLFSNKFFIRNSFFAMKKTKPDFIKQETVKKSFSIKDNAQLTGDNKSYEVKVNQVVALGDKTKEEVYELRKKFVEKSIFSNMDYEPSEEVFGQIVTGKPWYSASVCVNSTKPGKVGGLSEESRFINNPSVLVALEFPYNFRVLNDQKWCTSNVNNLIPKKIFYSKAKKIVTVVYERIPFRNSERNHYEFNGINANDLGYSFAYVDLNKSTFKPEFVNSQNISNKVSEFLDFIHVGFSCQLEGGCNNASPPQQELDFRVTNTQYTKHNGTIYIKLWKEYPSSVENEADMTEIIVLENY